VPSVVRGGVIPDSETRHNFSISLIDRRSSTKFCMGIQSRSHITQPEKNVTSKLRHSAPRVRPHILTRA
jgi:hypothetical protein